MSVLPQKRSAQRVESLWAKDSGLSAEAYSLGPAALEVDSKAWGLQSLKFRESEFSDEWRLLEFPGLTLARSRKYLWQLAVTPDRNEADGVYR